jgi:hypothetical protein
LSLIGLIEEGMRRDSGDFPVMADLFSDLWELVATTVKGAKIDHLKPNQRGRAFQALEVRGENDEIMGSLNMLYFVKPIPCYYLVYVEVATPFRNRGLGHLVVRHFSDFLEEKGAIGLLDNIIPKDDPTTDIYAKNQWRPVKDVIGNHLEGFDDYMTYVPLRFREASLRDPMVRLVHHLKRRREAIDMKDNQQMVRRTLEEFKDLYTALMAYFQPQIEAGAQSALMRFMFTRFVTKLIAFRRKIAGLVGYTGGESVEQIAPHPFVAALPLRSYTLKDLAGTCRVLFSEPGLVESLPSGFLDDPSGAIESLPLYERPSLVSWLKSRNRTLETPLTIGDLLDIGFDPTRLKEMELAGEPHIFERVQARQVPELVEKREFLKTAAEGLKGVRIRQAELMANPPLMALGNRGNAYVLRRKVPGIHWEEAVAELRGNPRLKGLNQAMGLDRLIQATVRQTVTETARRMGRDESVLKDQLAVFVSWDHQKGQPRVVVDPSGTFLQTVWLA